MKETNDKYDEVRNLLKGGSSVLAACRKVGISAATYYTKREEHGDGIAAGQRMPRGRPKRVKPSVQVHYASDSVEEDFDTSEEQAALESFVTEGLKKDLPENLVIVTTTQSLSKVLGALR